MKTTGRLVEARRSWLGISLQYTFCILKLRIDRGGSCTGELRDNCLLCSTLLLVMCPLVDMMAVLVLARIDAKEGQNE